MRRTLALWLLLFATYAATLGLSAFGRSDYGGDEPHYLLAAESIVEDGDVDVRDEYATRAYADFYPYTLRRHGRETEGRLNEPHGVGFPLLIAPAYAVGGVKGVELFLAAIAALAVALAYRLALRVAPDPWALGAALAAGLSPPFLAYGTAVYPELAAGAALAGAALLALRLRTLVVGAVELSLFSVALYVAFNEALYGGPTPYAADTPGEGATDAGSPTGYLERSYRLVALFCDREYGLLRWARVFELGAALSAAALGAQLVVAAFVAPTMFGFWFPARHLLAGLPLAVPLVAMGMRHMPRTGGALAALGVVGSAWLYAEVRWGGGSFVTDRPDAPFGPLTDLLPRFEPGGGWPFWLAGAVGFAVLLLVLREARAARHSRHPAGATRARYSG